MRGVRRGYGSLGNLKLVRHCGWVWLTRLKANRLVNLNREGTRALRDTAIGAPGTEVWLTGYGLVKVFGIATPDGGTAYWATNDLGMTDLTRAQLADCSWAIESYHRGVKPCTGLERCQCRSAKAQRNHIGLARRAFLRLEAHGFARGSVGSRPRRRSSGTPSGPTSPDHAFASHDR